MQKEVTVRWENTEGKLEEGAVILRSLSGPEATDVETKAKVKSGNAFTTDEKKMRFGRLAKAMVSAPFKPSGKEWKDATEQERFDWLMTTTIDETVWGYLMLVQNRIGAMSEEVQNLLNTPSA